MSFSAVWGEAEQLVAQGLHACRYEAWHEAIVSLESATSREPDNALAWYYLSLAHRRLGDAARCIEFLRVAARLSPEMVYGRATEQYLTDRARVGDGAVYESGWLSLLDAALPANVLRSVTNVELADNLAGAVSPIPKTMMQFWDKKEPPMDVMKSIENTRALNPDFEHILLDDEAARDFIATHYGHDMVELYELCPHVSCKSDFIRAVFLYKMGGYYLDVDEVSLQSLSVALGANNFREIYSYSLAETSCINTWFIGSVPESKILGKFIEYILGNILAIKRHGVQTSAWILTGPGPLSFAVLDIATNPANFTSGKNGLEDVVFIDDPVYRKIIWSGEFDYKATSEGNWRLAV